MYMMMKGEVWKEIRPYLGVILMQFGSAGSSLITKAALNHGMSHFSYSVYRNVIAAVIVAPFAFLFERKIRPKMTMSVLFKIVLLALVEPVLDQNLFYGGMKYTTATFASAMANMVPAITFTLAWPLGLERVDLKRLDSQAKIVGTLVTFGGAMIMTLVKGAALKLPWSIMTSSPSSSNNQEMVGGNVSVKGAVMIIAGCFCWSSFYILQAMTLKSYPAALSLTGMICMVGAMLGTGLTLVVERGNPSVWAIGWDTKLLSYVYSGLVGSGLTYYVAGMVIKGKGPVFVTSFNPLSMIIVAVLSSIIFAEQMNVGKIAGAIVIVIGLYLVIWGKAKDQKAADDESQKLPELMMMGKEDEEDARTSTKIDDSCGGHDSCKRISAADNVV